MNATASAATRIDSAASLPNSAQRVRERAVAGRINPAWPWLMLFSRITLFAAFQSLIAAIAAMSGKGAPWDASAAWWPVTAIATNLVVIALQAGLMRREGLGIFDLYRLARGRVGRDVLLTLGLSLIGGPLGFLPNILLARLLWGGSETAGALFFRPLPLPVILVSIVLFPATNALAELSTYMGYVMPRLEAVWSQTRTKPLIWLPVALAGSMLAAQHCALPLLFDGRFLFWRLGMFLPFALFTAATIRWKPTLLPYMMMVHFLMDLQLIISLLSTVG